jgi:pilus assembly protein CpaF
MAQDPKKLQTIKDDEPTDPGMVIPAELLKAPPPKTPAAPAGALEEALKGIKPQKLPEMGPLNEFMKDPQITEIMVNDLRNVMIEKGGVLSFSGFRYQSIDELNRLVRNILDMTGGLLTPDHPYVDTMLPDGSRVNIVGAPLTANGPCLTIRKFPVRRYNLQALVDGESLDRRMARFLHGCVAGKSNVLISGGTGSGKTTLLNALMYSISKGERIVTIEDTPELAVPHANSVQMQTTNATPTMPAITARDLVANALRMRPDRIIVGESRRNEALDVLQAMNTGHAGSMTTIHANSPRDALSRLETLCMMTGVELPLAAIRKQIASALDLVVQTHRFRDGKRRVVHIAEVTGVEGDVITLQDIFVYDEQRGFHCLGLQPTLLPRLREHGIEFPTDFFS